ncbi:unnamed protein product [Prorocentrum cordatum]|uniref:Uncharacterized protein n=1 Tax=Prorocentrum cordatum TaxID=2364126 RepID=A0ABN9RUP6_9DINO|nr:unnamed protein product [Polarella glacialis]
MGEAGRGEGKDRREGGNITTSPCRTRRGALSPSNALAKAPPQQKKKKNGVLPLSTTKWLESTVACINPLQHQTGYDDPDTQPNNLAEHWTNVWPRGRIQKAEGGGDSTQASSRKTRRSSQEENTKPGARG